MILDATTILLPQDLGVTDSPTFEGLTLTGLTEGGLLFAGPGGLISEDNSNLFWKDDTNQLGIGTNTPTAGSVLDVRGGIDIGLDNTKLRFGAVQEISIEYDSNLANDGGMLIDLTSGGIANQNLNIIATGDSAALFIQGSDGFIGKGTIAPSSPFTVVESASGTDSTVIQVTADIDSNHSLIAIQGAATSAGLGTVTKQFFGINATAIYEPSDGVVSANTSALGGVGGRYTSKIIGTSDAVSSIINARGISARIWFTTYPNTVLTNAYTIYAESPKTDTLGGGREVTNAYGLYIDEQNLNQGGTNNVGIYVAETSNATYNNEIFLAGSGGIWFRDQAIAIFSQADTFLDLVADGGLRIGNANPATHAAPTTYLLIENDGDTYWVGDGTGLPGGHAYMFEGGETVSVASADVWYELTAGMSGYNLNEVTFGGGHYLAVDIAGTYDVDWSVSIKTAAAQQELMVSITVDGADNGVALNSESTDAKSAANHTTIVAANKSISLSGSTTLDLAANKQVSMIFMNKTLSTDIVVEHVCLTIRHAGGT